MAETIELKAVETRVRLARGETVRLCLAESPTTGFFWTRQGLLPDGLVEVDSGFTPGGSGMGASGLRCFTYRCDTATAAEAAVAFVLARPWKPSAAADTRQVLFDLASN